VTDPAALASAGQRVEPVAVRAAGVLARLDQRDRGDLAQPCPLRCGFGQCDDAALDLGVGELLAVRVGALPLS
jgi:hypothetical protein